MARRFASRTQARAEGARQRPSREGTSAPRCEVRVKPRCPADRLAAGIDAASTARRCQCQTKNGCGFLHPLRCWRGRVGRGLDRREPGRSGWKPPVRQPRPLNAANVASARSKSKLRNPRNPSRPGEDSGARERRAKPLPTLPHTDVVGQREAQRAPTAMVAGVDPATSRRMTGCFAQDDEMRRAGRDASRRLTRCVAQDDGMLRAG